MPTAPPLPKKYYLPWQDTSDFETIWRCIWLKDKLFKKSCLFKISIKILEVNFGNSILDNSKWDKISEGIAKNPYLELRCKKVIVKQKIRPPRYLVQISIWMIGLGILDIRIQLNSLKIKWIQMVIKSHQCFLEKSHDVSIKLSSEL